MPLRRALRAKHAAPLSRLLLAAMAASVWHQDPVHKALSRLVRVHDKSSHLRAGARLDAAHIGGC
jgi:hypothetical protein